MLYMTLNNGVRMPAVLMGTYPLKNAAMDIAVEAALACGYRGFDTAHLYGNEASLGQSLASSLPANGLKREDIFITTKVSEEPIADAPGKTIFTAGYPGERKDIRALVGAQVDESLTALKTDYIDLLLIHWPISDYFGEIWQAFGEIYAQGKARAIGVSNCFEWHLRKLREVGGPQPMVNQIERHPLLTQLGMIRLAEEIDMRIQAYSPLRFGGHTHDNLPPLLLDLAARHRRSVAQIILRWDVQQGVAPIPKSGTPARLRENIGIFDFSLTDFELTQIDLLNENYAFLPGERFCHGWNAFKRMQTPPALD